MLLILPNPNTNFTENLGVTGLVEAIVRVKYKCAVLPNGTLIINYYTYIKLPTML